jgi:hypothetical protein
MAHETTGSELVYQLIRINILCLQNKLDKPDSAKTTPTPMITFLFTHRTKGML